MPHEGTRSVLGAAPMVESRFATLGPRRVLLSSPLPHGSGLCLWQPLGNPNPSTRQLFQGPGYATLFFSP